MGEKPQLGVKTLPMDSSDLARKIASIHGGGVSEIIPSALRDRFRKDLAAPGLRVIDAEPGVEPVAPEGVEPAPPAIAPPATDAAAIPASGIPASVRVTLNVSDVVELNLVASGVHVENPGFAMILFPLGLDGVPRLRPKVRVVLSCPQGSFECVGLGMEARFPEAGLRAVVLAVSGIHGGSSRE